MQMGALQARLRRRQIWGLIKRGRRRNGIKSNDLSIRSMQKYKKYLKRKKKTGNRKH